MNNVKKDVNKKREPKPSNTKIFPNQSTVGKVIIRTAPHPTTGCRSFVGEKLLLEAISGKLMRCRGLEDSWFYAGKEILMSMHVREYGDGEWEIY